jgi:hypothetical protein
MAEGSLHWLIAATITRRQAAAVPRKAPKNQEFMTATLMDCIAAMPSFAGSRANAFMTKVENAKKTPAIVPQPSAVTSVRMEVKPLYEIIDGDGVRSVGGFAASPTNQLGEGFALGPKKEGGEQYDEHERWAEQAGAFGDESVEGEDVYDDRAEDEKP